MPRPSIDTRSEAKAVALKLFSTNGFEQTSLREIAERLGITKAALYYHFPSKTELLNELLDPLVSDLADFLTAAAALGPEQPRQILEAFFDVCARHRLLYQWLLFDVRALRRSQPDAVEPLVHWRDQLEQLLIRGSAPEERIRVVAALGGLQDCVGGLRDLPVETIRTAAVDAALRALLPGPTTTGG
ncbi:TetR/AcrR family transcriptional regulator [Quadrisphaera sp. DSM 44207]|uniref:TetR/AcrR family transcriptional regulator n=1 Tax=Quadrisphaera sp. DSM 44207 TaxID=1881057 RepID=UPI000890DD3F|nr:TetR/AcrR family transcriptional regulator [Quadrisphaera sp. DSM 44207]SDQ22390.1 transcriptional regulator, TetR family [Quadrisphaera sp. DSM 44207]